MKIIQEKNLFVNEESFGNISMRKAENTPQDPLKAQTKNCIIDKIFCLDYN